MKLNKKILGVLVIFAIVLSNLSYIFIVADEDNTSLDENEINKHPEKVKLIDLVSGGLENYRTVGLELFGKEVESDVPAILYKLNNETRTLVPIRVISEKIGASVKWEQEERIVKILQNDILIELKINQSDVFINGIRTKLPSNVPAKLMSYKDIARTYVPLRFISERFKLEVAWNPDDMKVEISRSKAELERIQKEKQKQKQEDQKKKQEETTSVDEETNNKKLNILNSVNSIETFGGENCDRIDLHFSRKIEQNCNSFMIEKDNFGNPWRLVIDMDMGVFGFDKNDKKIKNGQYVEEISENEVYRLRVGEVQKQPYPVLRFVVDLKSEKPYKIIKKDKKIIILFDGAKYDFVDEDFKNQIISRGSDRNTKQDENEDKKNNENEEEKTEKPKDNKEENTDSKKEESIDPSKVDTSKLEKDKYVPVVEKSDGHNVEEDTKKKKTAEYLSYSVVKPKEFALIRINPDEDNAVENIHLHNNVLSFEVTKSHFEHPDKSIIISDEFTEKMDVIALESIYLIKFELKDNVEFMVHREARKGVSGEYILRLNDIKKEISPEKKLIVLDPGHGGQDAGARSVLDGTTELSLLEEFMPKLKKSLEDRGFAVAFTRDENRYMSLYHRVKYPELLGADLLVSVHVNAAGYYFANGIENFYSKAKPLTKKLASKIHKRMIEYTGATDRGIKDYDLYITREAHVVSTLLELGFLSNSTELKKLKDGSYQLSLAEAIAVGISDYFQD